ncbi:hypothetical protein Hanom_Chr03g00263401 [Helianthus anomalus]
MYFMSFSLNIFLTHFTFYETLCFPICTNPLILTFVKSFKTTFHLFNIPHTKFFWIFCLSCIIQLLCFCP